MFRFPRLLCVSLFILLTARASAGIVISGWDFQNLSVATNLTPASDLGPVAGAATALGMNNTYPTPGPGVDISDVLISAGSSDPAGDNNNAWRVRSGIPPGSTVAANGWSSLAPIGTQGAQFMASTAGCSGIKVTFDLNTTAQAEANLQVQYTLDGKTWINTPITYTGPGASIKVNTISSDTVKGTYIQFTGGAWFNQITADLSGITGANNNPNFGVRMVNASTGNDNVNGTGTAYNNSSGNWRFDEVLVIANTAAPFVVNQPQPAITAAAGGSVAFSMAAVGAPAPTYQWLKNGSVIAGATSPALVLRSVTAADAASYSCAVTNAQGAVMSSGATLAIGGTAAPGLLVNGSILINSGSGGRAPIIGFVVSGAAGATKAVLARAIGPALSAFGVGGVLADPSLNIVGGGTLVASNDNWSSPSGNGAAVTSAAAATGAFPLTAQNGLDAALVATLAPGAYTMQIAGNGSTNGFVLAEVYDAFATAPASARLSNLSALGQVGPVGNPLVAGFVISGPNAKTVLVRGMGPSLATFVPGSVLPDSQLVLFSGRLQIASNVGWGGDLQLKAVSDAVGAFRASSATNTDSMILITLPPGAYTALISSPSGATGLAMVEVYEVP